MLYGNAGIIDLHNLSVLNKSIVPHFDNINNLIYDILGTVSELVGTLTSDVTVVLPVLSLMVTFCPSSVVYVTLPSAFFSCLSVGFTLISSPDSVFTVIEPSSSVVALASSLTSIIVVSSVLICNDLLSSTN